MKLNMECRDLVIIGCLAFGVTVQAADYSDVPDINSLGENELKQFNSYLESKNDLGRLIKKLGTSYERLNRTSVAMLIHLKRPDIVSSLRNEIDNEGNDNDDKRIALNMSLKSQVEGIRSDFKELCNAIPDYCTQRDRLNVFYSENHNKSGYNAPIPEKYSFAAMMDLIGKFDRIDIVERANSLMYFMKRPVGHCMVTNVELLDQENKVIIERSNNYCGAMSPHIIFIMELVDMYEKKEKARDSELLCQIAIKLQEYGKASWIKDLPLNPKDKKRSTSGKKKKSRSRPIKKEKPSIEVTSKPVEKPVVEQFLQKVSSSSASSSSKQSVVSEDETCMIVQDNQNKVRIHLQKQKIVGDQFPHLIYNDTIQTWLSDHDKAMREQGYCDPSSDKHQHKDGARLVHAFSRNVDTCIQKCGTMSKIEVKAGTKADVINMRGFIIHKNGDKQTITVEYFINPKTGICFHRNLKIWE